jgi:hypothetical protein
MARHGVANRLIAGTVTIVGLASVWVAIISVLPSQQDLQDAEKMSLATAVATMPRVIAREHKPESPAAPALPEPTLDLSIPGVPPGGAPVPPSESSPESFHRSGAGPSTGQMDPRMAQVVRMKCDAQIEQLCPEDGEEGTRASCLERKKSELALPCRQQLRERFVKWKADRNRVAVACQEDIRLYCVNIAPGDGKIVQCLQEHSQKVSDRCYETLPKGAVLFRQ